MFRCAAVLTASKEGGVTWKEAREECSEKGARLASEEEWLSLWASKNIPDWVWIANHEGRELPTKAIRNGYAIRSALEDKYAYFACSRGPTLSCSGDFRKDVEESEKILKEELVALLKYVAECPTTLWLTGYRFALGFVGDLMEWTASLVAALTTRSGTETKGSIMDRCYFEPITDWVMELTHNSSLGISERDRRGWLDGTGNRTAVAKALANAYRGCDRRGLQSSLLKDVENEYVRYRLYSCTLLNDLLRQYNVCKKSQLKLK